MAVLCGVRCSFYYYYPGSAQGSEYLDVLRLLGSVDLHFLLFACVMGVGLTPYCAAGLALCDVQAVALRESQTESNRVSYDRVAYPPFSPQSAA